MYGSGHEISARKSERKRQPDGWDENINMELNKISLEGVGYVDLSQRQAFVNTVMNLS